MIEAVPTGFFAQDFELHKHRRPIAKLDVSAWREAAEIQIDGEPYTFRRERSFGGAFLLERGGEVLVRATKPSAFKSLFEVEVEGRTYTLKRISAWRREFGLFAHNQRVGAVTPRAWYTRGSVIRLPDGCWPTAVHAFVFWLVLIIWKRQAAAAAGG
jgi:hypothetical protein